MYSSASQLAGGDTFKYTLTSSSALLCNGLAIHRVEILSKVVDSNNSLEPFDVACDAKLAGAGWTVILRRSGDKVNFYRKWAQYKQGFGDLGSDFFIGLDKLHAITTSQPHELYVHLEDFDGESRYALYDDFQISNEAQDYALAKLGSYSGDAGNSLSDHLHYGFTTYDNDNDGWGDGNCAQWAMGAYWYNNCGPSVAL
ncbi:ficolin-1-like [Scaptodrosophila lebanonensis]|uniref:Ficolin-1-like n=1 Tax=Drosophila lebanonensis TaxID=7225 RepID=A0A6J2TMF1_DROLE|nr:ficolin-1-like [Scaptodrosophila lebanonensis]